ncbi:MAG TPA: NADH-ubiquinone oxidoreductase-F iron-sulfur binding region domain-containing protein [Pirellulales bacterium]|jgi:NADH:ubiquinone oxidoreductase subunit F (NADH-binding)/NADH:ubiquinone oxidoreductase subunit E|nr:NADH-ubiquinone oxidoreductase-F iron-sulfur binding region domain-containing protein [Pirellulales bacterium]
MIVQELYKIQHRHGFLPADELRGLSERMAVPLYRLHEVASYFPHYRLQPPSTVEVRVCRDMACHLHGSTDCRKALEQIASEIGGSQVKVDGASCLGRCDGPPAVAINDQVYWGKSAMELESIIRGALAGQPLPHQHGDTGPLEWKIDPYAGEPLYEVARRLIESWKADPDTDRQRKRIRLGDPVLAALEAAKLRGMGGAAFPTFKKWSIVRGAPGSPKYSVCNGDESEPGTFKDRELLRRAPHLVIEGMIVGALVTGCERGWIFIRHEYEQEIQCVRRALADAERQGVCGQRLLGSDLSFPLEVFVSPGGYICGEETALAEVLEDRRAEPRNKPPLMSLEGLFGKPTSMNNVETFSWVPAILTHGGAWYRDQGINGATGLRLHSISGDVNRPGVYEIPFGLTLGELVNGLAGGIRGGQRLKAVATSGPSGGFLPPQIPLPRESHHFTEGLVKRKVVAEGAESLDLLTMPLDPDLFRPFPDFMLGAAIVVYGDRANLLEQALNCVEFFRNESCGKCVPCRIGTTKLAAMLRERLQSNESTDFSLVGELADAMFTTSICGLGQVAPSPIRSVMKYFPEELSCRPKLKNSKP